MKWIQRVLLKIESGHVSVHRLTDGQTDKVKPVYPLSTSLKRVNNNDKFFPAPVTALDVSVCKYIDLPSLTPNHLELEGWIGQP